LICQFLKICAGIIPALGRLRQEKGEFKASLGYIEFKVCLSCIFENLSQPPHPKKL
jgi:hypothetical protein